MQNVQVATTLSQVYSLSWGYSEAAQCAIDTTGSNPCTAVGGSSAAYVTQTNQVRVDTTADVWIDLDGTCGLTHADVPGEMC